MIYVYVYISGWGKQLEEERIPGRVPGSLAKAECGGICGASFSVLQMNKVEDGEG